MASLSSAGSPSSPTPSSTGGPPLKRRALACISNLSSDAVDDAEGSVSGVHLVTSEISVCKEVAMATSPRPSTYCDQTNQGTREVTGDGRHLPPELWLRIFRQAAVVSQRSLARAATASFAFKGMVEEALYHHPELPSIWSAKHFLATVSKDRRRARMVHGLRLGCHEHHTEEYIVIMTSIFSLLGRLESLDLVGLGNECISEESAADLLYRSQDTLPSLRRIRGPPLYVSPPLLLRLARISRLEELRLYAYTRVPHSDADYDLSETRVGSACVPILQALPNLRALSCPREVLASMQVSGGLTSLCITDVVTRAVLDHAASLFGEQLTSLRVERKLGRYSGMGYPTNWSIWTKFVRLKFLDVHDVGRRGREIDGQAIKVENLPPTLETLVWGASWAMDCALMDARPEKWRRGQIRAFAETVLSQAPGMKAVVYRWHWSSRSGGKSYHCVLISDTRRRLCEALADPAVADEDAWAERR